MALYRGLISLDDIAESKGKVNESYNNLEFFENITIRDWIEIILEYEVYESNDTEQEWWRRGEEGWFHLNGKHFLLDEKTQNTRLLPYLGKDLSPSEDLGYPMTDFVRENLGSNELIKESALFDCKLRQFFF